MNTKRGGQRNADLDRGNAGKEGERRWCGDDNSSHHHRGIYILAVKNLDLGLEGDDGCVLVREKAEKKSLERERSREKCF
jgi:hypothetical protein